ncbi:MULTISPECIES: ABC transporter permease [Haloferax]|uniref:ABC transporter permease subunit n=2 Tax=Haloferax TaxID=2251 RepID=A0A6G1Z631_9EURY|nr:MULTISPECIES: ABC transporter permease [Haloferax]KAB1185327.1 ABC transporter permease [Haloferax sp. CBA1149]MRW81963.1 ABC transporter permease subunit [Haloferax marinisediminis]
MSSQTDSPPDRTVPQTSELQRRLTKFRETLSIVFDNDMAKVGAVMLTLFVLMAVFAPVITPNVPDERVTTDDGSWVKEAGPSAEYPLGTTTQAYPIFSQLVYGTRIAFIAGLLTALMVGGIGTLAGIVSGYYGGVTESAIMRLVDITYGIPFLPFAIVLIIVVGGGSIFNIVFAISLLLWRGTARVIRSEVISIKEQPMITAAKASGASNKRIMLYHILPKVLPTSVLYSVFAIGWAIIAEAGLSFIGLGDPDMLSWGKMLNTAYVGNAIQLDMWNWIIPPGLFITLFVISAYFVSQGIEEVVNPQLREP